MTRRSVVAEAAGKRKSGVKVGANTLQVSNSPTIVDFVAVFTMAPAERVALVKRGIPARAVVWIARAAGQPKDQVVRLLGLPRSTVDRKARAKQALSVAQSERVVGLVRLVGQVQKMVEESGDPAGFDAAKWLTSWLKRPLPALGGHTPAEYMDTSEGQQLVSTLLARAQSGVFA